MELNNQTPAQQPLRREDLMPLETYAENRAQFKERVLRHKLHRRIAVGPNMNLYFEDRLTIQYQIQEMLRIEKVFEAAGIQEELDAYNPLIPNGSNLKATAMLEYADVEERKVQLAALRGVEDLIWMQVHSHEPVYAIANEDLERSNAEKTSAVHFLRFEFSAAMIGDARLGKTITIGVNHPAYQHQTELNAEQGAALRNDFA